MDDEIEAMLARTDVLVCDGCVGDYKDQAAEWRAITGGTPCRKCQHRIGSGETAWMILKDAPA